MKKIITRLSPGRSGAQRGLTLIELLSAIFVMLLLTTNLFLMLTTGKRIWQASLSRTASHQDLRSAFEKINGDMQNSSPTMVTNNSGGSPSAFGFLSAYNQEGNFVTDEEGNPVWQKYVLYYLENGTSNLRKREIYGSYTEPLTVAEMATYCNGGGRIVNPSIKSMDIDMDAGSNSATITLNSQSTTRLGKTDRQSLEMTIFMRN